MMVGPKWMVMLYIGKSHYIYTYMYLYIMNGRQNFLLLQKNMAKVGGPQCEGFDATFNIPCPLPITVVFRQFCHYKSVHIYI